MKHRIKRYYDWCLDPVSSQGVLVGFRFLFGIFMVMDSIAFSIYSWKYFHEGPIHFKYPGLFWWPHFTLEVNQWLFAVWTIMGFLLALGWYARWAALGCLLSVLHLLFQDASFFLNHLALNALVSFLFIFLPENSSEFRRYHLMSFRWLFLMTYFYGGLAKLRADWWSGDILALNMASRARWSWIANEVMHWEGPVCQWIAWGVLCLQLLTPWGLSWKKTKPTFMVLLIVFHILSDQLLNIGLFSYLMIFAMILYFDAVSLPVRWKELLLNKAYRIF